MKKNETSSMVTHLKKPTLWVSATVGCVVMSHFQEYSLVHKIIVSGLTTATTHYIYYNLTNVIASFDFHDNTSSAYTYSHYPSYTFNIESQSDTKAEMKKRLTQSAYNVAMRKPKLMMMLA